MLLPDLRSTANERGSEAMACLHGDMGSKNPSRLRLPPTGARLGRRDRIRLEAMSGEVIYHLAPQRAGVQVLWLPTPSCKAINKDATALTFKRWAYWRNSRRCDYIAAVARAFANGDLEKLASYGVPFRGEKPLVRIPGTPRSSCWWRLRNRLASWPRGLRDGKSWMPCPARPRGTTMLPAKILRLRDNHHGNESRQGRSVRRCPDPRRRKLGRAVLQGLPSAAHG